MERGREALGRQVCVQRRGQATYVAGSLRSMAQRTGLPGLAKLTTSTEKAKEHCLCPSEHTVICPGLLSAERVGHGTTWAPSTASRQLGAPQPDSLAPCLLTGPQHTDAVAHGQARSAGLPLCGVGGIKRSRSGAALPGPWEECRPPWPTQSMPPSWTACAHSKCPALTGLGLATTGTGSGTGMARGLGTVRLNFLGSVTLAFVFEGRG